MSSETEKNCELLLESIGAEGMQPTDFYVKCDDRQFHIRRSRGDITVKKRQCPFCGSSSQNFLRLEAGPNNKLNQITCMSCGSGTVVRTDETPFTDGVDSEPLLLFFLHGSVCKVLGAQMAASICHGA